MLWVERYFVGLTLLFYDQKLARFNDLYGPSCSDSADAYCDDAHHIIPRWPWAGVAPWP
jgi:hypothetical protein